MLRPGCNRPAAALSPCWSAGSVSVWLSMRRSPPAAMQCESGSLAAVRAAGMARMRQNHGRGGKPPQMDPADRKSGVEGKSVSVREDHGGRRFIKKKQMIVLKI